MKILLALLFYISIFGWTWGDSVASKNREASRLYKDGKVEDALSKWRDAQIENPDSDKLHYNIGNGLHENKDYEEAFKEYGKALTSKNSELRSKAYYNIGNTQYRMGKLQEAIDSYKKCLEINPKDEDAKYNVEFIEKKLKEKPKEEKQEESKSQENKENKEKEQEKQAQSSQQPEQEEKKQGQEEQQKQPETRKAAEEEKKDEDKKQQQAVEEDKQGEKKEADKTHSEEEKKSEMSKEDAVRLLDAFKDDEKDLQKELRTQPIEGRYKVDKDW